MDIDKLEALARAATPGPWQGDRIDGTVKYDIISAPFTEDFKVVMHGDNGNSGDCYGFNSAADEDYVLAANPAAILELCAELRALRTRLEIDSEKATVDCPKCGEGEIPAGRYCKAMGCPLNPATRGGK